MEKYKVINGQRFFCRHVVRSLASGRAHQKSYEAKGYHVHVMKEGAGKYLVLTRRVK